MKQLDRANLEEVKGGYVMYSIPIDAAILIYKAYVKYYN